MTINVILSSALQGKQQDGGGRGPAGCFPRTWASGELNDLQRGTLLVQEHLIDNIISYKLYLITTQTHRHQEEMNHPQAKARLERSH